MSKAPPICAHEHGSLPCPCSWLVVAVEEVTGNDGGGIMDEKKAIPPTVLLWQQKHSYGFEPNARDTGKWSESCQ